MPLIIITGYPSSGKTSRSHELKTYFENELGKPTRLISEEEIMSQCNTDKNASSMGKELSFMSLIQQLFFSYLDLCLFCFSDSKEQKEIRASLKCNVVRYESLIYLLMNRLPR